MDDKSKRKLRKLLRRIIQIKGKPNLKVLDKEIFIRCKSIKRFIKKCNLYENDAKKHLPAVVICALIGNKYKIDTSGKIPKKIANNLRVRLLSIGEIGRTNNVNIVGNCAEVNSSNYLLLKKQIPLNEVKFTNAYRPRTSQIINRCNNCIQTFQ